MKKISKYIYLLFVLLFFSSCSIFECQYKEPLPDKIQWALLIWNDIYNNPRVQKTDKKNISIVLDDYTDYEKDQVSKLLNHLYSDEIIIVTSSNSANYDNVNQLKVIIEIFDLIAFTYEDIPQMRARISGDSISIGQFYFLAKNANGQWIIKRKFHNKCGVN